MMEEFNIQGKQTSFYMYCPGTFGYTLVYFRCRVHLQFNVILPLSEEANLSLLTDTSTTSYVEMSQDVSQGTCELQGTHYEHNRTTFSLTFIHNKLNKIIRMGFEASANGAAHDSIFLG